MAAIRGSHGEDSGAGGDSAGSEGNLLASGYASFWLETGDADPCSLAPFSKDILIKEGVASHVY